MAKKKKSVGFNLKRALWMGALLYVISFIVGMIIGVVMGVDFSSASEVPDSVWHVGIVFTVIFTVLFSLWYFNKVKASARSGLHLGIMFIVIGFVLDLILIIPWILTSDSPADILAYYTNPLFWITLAIILVCTSAVGHLRSK